MTKGVYLFREGNATMRDILGGKGANLAEMTNIGLPVPPGFTITTEMCNRTLELGRMPDGLWEEILGALSAVEADLGKCLGDAANPLLLSVRSGARFSMPGMMDTVLNLGLNEDTLQGLIQQTGNERFAFDAYRRFIMMFSDIVLSDDKPTLTKHHFEQIFDELKRERGAKSDTEVDAAGLKELVGRFKQYFHQQYGGDFPSDPREQLRLAIMAVFNSWQNPRATAYRNFSKIPHDLGTAVNIQAMVFGNMGDDSGTGVAFTRDVATGEAVLYGEYLMNAQGEDVVAGVRTPVKIAELERQNPAIYKEFLAIGQRLEAHYRDVQDPEFTIEKGRLFILQCRSGKRTAAAAVKIAVDLVREGVISRNEALARVEPNQIYQLLLPRFDPAKKEGATKSGNLLAKGLNASPGAASGIAVFNADRAAEWGGEGKRVVLVRPETNPDDVHGMLVAKGILTARGGATSHAAVVARGLGLPCVAGCEAINVSEEARQFTVDGRTLKEGDEISIDGTTGEVFAGIIPTIDPNFDEEHDLRTLLAGRMK